MKVRHFKLEGGKLFIDNCGDFLHINDIELLLRQKKDERQAMVDQYKAASALWMRPRSRSRPMYSRTLRQPE